MGLNRKAPSVKMPGCPRVDAVTDAFVVLRRVGDNKTVTVLNQLIESAQNIALRPTRFFVDQYRSKVFVWAVFVLHDRRYPAHGFVEKVSFARRVLCVMGLDTCRESRTGI